MTNAAATPTPVAMSNAEREAATVTQRCEAAPSGAMGTTVSEQDAPAILSEPVRSPAATFTPGPWVAGTDETGGGKGWVYSENENGDVRSIAHCHLPHMSFAEAYANSFLMAAAPDLLKAMGQLSAQLRKRECSVADCRALDAADAAFVKATGA